MVNMRLHYVKSHLPWASFPQTLMLYQIILQIVWANLGKYSMFFQLPCMICLGYIWFHGITLRTLGLLCVVDFLWLSELGCDVPRTYTEEQVTQTDEQIITIIILYYIEWLPSRARSQQQQPGDTNGMVKMRLHYEKHIYPGQAYHTQSYHIK